MKKYLFLSNGKKDMLIRTGTYSGCIDVISKYASDNRIKKGIAKLLLRYCPVFAGPLLGKWAGTLSKYDVIVCEALYGNRDIFKYILRKKRFDSRLIMWHWNKIDKHEIQPDDEVAKQCEQWSFDKNDCEKYELRYNSQYYFKTSIYCQDGAESKKYGAYFLGSDKGRLANISEIKDMLENNGIETYFHVVCSEESKGDYPFKNSISYYKNCENIMSSICIVDIPVPNQNGLTLRVLESLFFHKKLITTNKDICKLDFYSKNNIFIYGVDENKYLSKFMDTPYKETQQTRAAEQYYQFENWMQRFNI